MTTPTLRRGSDAYFRDLLGDWIACKVMRVSGSGEPSVDITVEFVTRQYSCNGFIPSGVVLERNAREVVPSTAMVIGPYGHMKSAYKCQETYPEQRKRKANGKEETAGRSVVSVENQGIQA